MKKVALGRGLGALIEDAKYEKKGGNENVSVAPLNEIELSKIQTNPFQPRTKFDDETIAELSQSIKELGVIQPITVRRVEGDMFQIISGERRFRASQLAGLQTVPAYVREANDQAMLEMALVENIQREDLNPIEVAISYQRLMDECSLTQDSLSDRVGKKRATISNYVRLLKLPAEIQIGLRDQLISMGHAKTLITIEDREKQLKAYFRIVNEGLSVRAAEELARQIQNPEPAKQPAEPKQASLLPDRHTQVSSFLRDRLQAKIEIKRNDKGQGFINIPFASDADLERIADILQRLG